MRRGGMLGAALGVINAGVVFLLEWALRRRDGSFGWYSYSPMPRRYTDYLAPEHVVNGWAAVAVFAGVLIAMNAVVVTTYVVVRHRRTSAR